MIRNRKPKGAMSKIKIQLIILMFFSAILSILPLNAGSRLGKVNGVMEEIIAVNLGSIHGIRQGQRGKVFMFNEDLKEVDVAFIQVIGVSEESCLARITELKDSLQIGQFVDIEGARPPQRLEKVDILAEMEENARNYFAANQYTEPDSANCLSTCNRILMQDPENRLAIELKNTMKRNYYQWAENERLNGSFTYAIIYYSRILRIDPDEQTAYQSIWDMLTLMDAEAQIELDDIQMGNPPDYYYAVAEQYYINGQYDKSKKYFEFILDRIVENDPAALEGIRKCDKMLALIVKLAEEKNRLARENQLEEQRHEAHLEEERRKVESSRYYRVVAEDLFNKKQYEQSLVYYLKILDLFPADSISLARRKFISRTNMVVIPSGVFSFGSNSSELNDVMIKFGANYNLYRELPKRWAYQDSFYIDRYEVTNRQYKSFIESTGHGPPLNWVNGNYNEDEADFPVVYVSWYDAQAYAHWVGKRLPNENEWEKAARSEEGYQWPWGEQFYEHRANTGEAMIGQPMPVGSYLGGANMQGVLDLAGNVWEWVDANLEPYPGYGEEMHYFPKGIHKVIRGGSYKETGEKARGAYRGAGKMDRLYIDVGFRCAADLHPQRENPGGL